MAAPTDVRVEAFSQTDTNLYWVYAGSNALSIYRSLNGSSYTLLTAVASSIVTYNDTLLTAGTKYYYKISDDAGLTFSSVVSTWTHICITEPGQGSQLNLPRASDQVTQDDFNLAMERLEQMNATIISTDPCNVCIDDGRITLDCSSGCSEFYVEVTEDINSISIIHCNEGADGQAGTINGSVNFFVPPNTTRKICGWPQGLGFGGDECFRSPISGGASGRTVGTGSGSGSKQSSKSKPGPGGSSGGGSGGAGGCQCVPGKNNALAIKSCNANNSLKCSSTRSLNLLTCGGKGPYSWSRTGTVGLKGSGQTTPGATASGSNITVTPPANTGSAVAGTAYCKACYDCSACFSTPGGCGSVSANKSLVFGCDDSFLDPGCVTISCPCSPSVPSASSMTCHNGTGSPTECAPADGPSCGQAPCPDTECGSMAEAVCDNRSAGMISAGCNPCGLQSGVTVTVTDANGVSVTIILRA